MMNGSSSCCPKRKRKDVVVFSPTAANDRISQLPRPILHHILSFLRTKDVVRTGILSKTWYHTSTSFPISNFYLSLVGHPRGDSTEVEWIQIFIDFVRKSLQNQCQIYGNIPKFVLSMVPSSQHNSSIKECIQLAIHNNVKVLDLDLMRRSARVMMPQTLTSAKDLILLSLCGCHLPLPLTHGVPTWPFLRKLCLHHCRVDAHIFQNLSFSCPLLESLFLLFCDELQDIRLSGLTKLTEVDIARSFDSDTRDIMVELDVPCLETFALYSVSGRCNVDLTTCKNITVLRWSYYGPMFSSKDLTNLIAGLPALESLELCWTSDRIRFSSQRLKNLEIKADQLLETDLPELIAGLPALKSLSLQCYSERIEFSSQQLEELDLTVPELVEVSIDAPSLKTFKCSNEVLSSDLFMGRSSPQEVTINFFNNSAFSLLELRKFVAGFNQIKLLKLCLCHHDRWLPAELMDIPVVPALPDIKHLRILPGFELQAPARGDCVALLNGLLWSCRPESMSIDFRSYGKFMTMLLCEELLKMVKGKHCCTDVEHIKCGFHGLGSFQIKQSGGNADASFISCDEFLELLPTLSSKVEIHFMLEWQC